MSAATVPYDWELYDLGFNDGVLEKIDGLEDRLWYAIPRRTYLRDYEYWDGYDEGYHLLPRRTHDPRRRLRASFKS